VAGCCEDCNEHVGSIGAGKFLDQFSVLWSPVGLCAFVGCLCVCVCVCACSRDSVHASVMCVLPSKCYYQHDIHAAVCYRAHFSACQYSTWVSRAAGGIERVYLCSVFM
jgi:hypothetical protein